MDEALKLASDLAEASGREVYLIARPFNKGWCASISNSVIENDGSTPFEAVHGAMQGFVSVQKSNISQAKKTLDESNSKLEALKQYE